MTTVPAPGDELAGSASPMSWGGTIVAACLLVLGRPGAWAVGLAGFLARGGIVLLALPIIVLPTPAGLQTELGQLVGSFLLAGTAARLTLLIGGLVVAVAAALVAGALAAAWAERAGIGFALEAGAEEDLVVAPPRLDGAPGPGRIAVVRLLGLLPIAIALVAVAPAVYEAVYRELLLPAELRTPLLVRVVAAVPWAFALVLVAWAIGDAAASMGVRRLVLEHRGTVAAWILGWWALVRHLPSVLATSIAGIAALIVCVTPGLAAAVIGWDRVREAFLAPLDPLGMTITVVVWVAVWLGALVLAGVAAAFRGAAWTYLALRG